MDINACKPWAGPYFLVLQDPAWNIPFFSPLILIHCLFLTYQICTFSHIALLVIFVSDANVSCDKNHGPCLFAAFLLLLCTLCSVSQLEWQDDCLLSQTSLSLGSAKCFSNYSFFLNLTLSLKYQYLLLLFFTLFNSLSTCPKFTFGRRP